MSYQEIVNILQRRLAEVDLLTEPRKASRHGSLELLLLKLKNIKLKIYQEIGHAMPHIHIDYGKQNHAASFSIKNPSRIEGSLNKKYDKQIISWINQNKETLLGIWNEMQIGSNAEYLIAHLVEK